MEKSGEEGMPDLAHVMRILSAENIPNLPPGGGLAGKYNPHLSPHPVVWAPTHPSGLGRVSGQGSDTHFLLSRPAEVPGPDLCAPPSSPGDRSRWSWECFLV